MFGRMVSEHRDHNNTLLTPPVIPHAQCGRIGDALTFQRLPSYLFGSVKHFFEPVHALQASQTRPFAIHFNFFNGLDQKVKVMKKYDMWRPDEYLAKDDVEGEVPRSVCQEENYVRYGRDAR